MMQRLLLGLIPRQPATQRATSGTVGLLRHCLGFSTATASHQHQRQSLLVLHPASLSNYSLLEACKLAESLEGRVCTEIMF